MKTIDRAGLDRWANEHRPFALLDVLQDHSHMDLEEDVDEGTALRARSDFLEQVSQLGIEKDQAVVLYATATGVVDSDTAADLLNHAGFLDVYHFVGPQAEVHKSQHDCAVG